ncbi:MAG: hypothetical protein RBT37_01860 [Dissulfurispiraceae bacterium]|jgi:tRNA nucleotidyltransferase/poly(A) polymerase|nr:hypothetical protein [Dissulfurispiraceae bacterium]
MLNPLLSSLINFISSKNLTDSSFFVGGAVRDIISGTALKDIDIAVNADVISLGKEFAKLTGCTAVPFENKTDTVRIVKHNRHIDISRLKGSAINEDLGQRDITINSMALPLSAASGQLSCSAELLDIIIDPFGGRRDLDNRIIRMISEKNLLNDPLRLLRLYRFAGTLNFALDPETAAAAARLSHTISRSAPERIVEELKQIFKLDNSAEVMHQMSAAGLLESAIPEINGNSDKSLIRYTATEDALRAFLDAGRPEEFPLLMNIAELHNIFCLKFSSLMPDSSAAAKASERLKLSNSEADLIIFLAKSRKEIVSLYKSAPKNPGETEMVCLILSAGGSPLGACIAGLAELQAEEGPEETADFIQFIGLITGYFQKIFLPRAALLPLVTGEEIMKKFSLNPSPFIGESIKNIGNLVLLGSISTKEEAFMVVEKLFALNNIQLNQ